MARSPTPRNDALHAPSRPETHAGQRHSCPARRASSRHAWTIWPANGGNAAGVLGDPHLGYVARYALGRDYHKVLRSRLRQLASRIERGRRVRQPGVRRQCAGAREGARAQRRSRLDRQAHNLLDRDAGSWFLLGEVFTDLPLPVDAPVTAHCGSCTACLDVCPTGAIVAPYELDARRCISYLTIELRGSIPEELRAPIGNRIFGCDDCQLFCPWNKFAHTTAVADFRRAARPRRRLARRAVRVDRDGMVATHRRQRDPPRRLRRLATQHRGRTRQCPDRSARSRRARNPSRRSLTDRPRARAVGLGPPWPRGRPQRRGHACGRAPERALMFAAQPHRCSYPSTAAFGSKLRERSRPRKPQKRTSGKSSPSQRSDREAPVSRFRNRRPTSSRGCWRSAASSPPTESPPDCQLRHSSRSARAVESSIGTGLRRFFRL